MISIINEFETKVNEHPDKLLYTFLDIKGNVKESYTYLDFFSRVSAIASHLYATRALEPEDRALLVYPPGLEMICAFFACVKIGAIPVPVYPPSARGYSSSADIMNYIAENCDASAVLTDCSYLWSFKINSARRNKEGYSKKHDITSKLKWITSDDVTTTDFKDIPHSHSNILFLQYTSGSTGDPKGVMVTHDNIANNCLSIVDHEPIGVSWLPQYHDMGLIGYYLYPALTSGTTYGFSPFDFVQNPALWLETISKYSATTSSAPNFAYEYCLRPGKIPEINMQSIDLKSLNFLMTAAEPVDPTIYEAFLERFKPNGLKPDIFYSAYGLAEFTLAVTSRGNTRHKFSTNALKKHEVFPVPRDHPECDSTTLMSCGILLGDAELKFVEIGHNKKEASEGQVGEIWIDGSSKCKGYWNRPDLTKEIFEAYIQGYSNTWLRTGDLGFVYQGELYICGREKDMVIIRGLNYYPHDIEAIVEEDEGIRNGSVAAFSRQLQGGESLVVVAGLKNKKATPDARAINARMLNYLGIRVETFVFVPARTIAKTSSGKIMRSQTKDHFLRNELEVIYRIDYDQPDNLGGDPGSGNGVEEPTQNTTTPAGLGNLTILFRSYGLSVSESQPLGKAGLDSLRLAEFASDLKKHMESSDLHDLSHTIDLRVLQKLPVSELFNLLIEIQNGSLHSKFLFRRAFSLLQKEFETLEIKEMKKDVGTSVVTGLDDKLPKLDNSTGAVLLTGGTGFFGPFLVKSLLEQNKEDIYIIVRDKNKNQGLNRLRTAFNALGYSNDMHAQFDRRIIPVCGDISQRNLGIDDKQWNFLANHIHTIYHNGAQVNYLSDYGTMRDANVNGTGDIVRFALDSRRKLVNHISTTFIFGWSVKDTLFENDNNEEMENLDFGYSQTKWVAEHIISRAMDKGLHARIYRPALISPSIGGEGFNFDISVRLLSFMVNNSIGTSAKNQVSFIPADIAANNIVAISNIEASTGKIFHVTRDTYETMLDITNIFSKLTNRHFAIFPLEQFIPEVVQRCQKEDLLAPLLNFLVGSSEKISSMQFKRYDNSNYKKFRDLSAWGRKDQSLENVVLGIYRFMERQGILKR